MTIEKSLATALEPIVDEIVALEKRINEVDAKIPTEAPAVNVDVDVDAVVSALKADEEFIATTKAVAPEIDPAAVADELVKSHADVVRASDLYADAWESGKVYRKGAKVSHHIGQIFIAKQDTYAEPDSNDEWERQGHFGFRHTGVYKEGHQYRDGDLCAKDFGTFMAIGGQLKLIAGRGGQGHRGERGLQGKTGPAGKDGKDGRDGPSDEQVIELVKSFVDLARENERLEIVDYIKTVTAEQIFHHATDSSALPVSFYRGLWQLGVTYRKGDVVNFNNAVCIAKRENVSVSPEGTLLDPAAGINDWRIIIKAQGGGQADGLGWPPSVTSSLDMMGFSINNVTVGAGPGSLANKGYVDSRTAPAYALRDTATLNTAIGASVLDKLMATTGGTATAGTRVFVGFSSAPGADNSQAGLWTYNGSTWTHIILGSSAAGGGAALSIKSGTATVLSTHGTSPIAAMTAGYAAMFGGAPASGQMVIITGGTATDAQFNGTYIFDGKLWHLISPDVSSFISGDVKNTKAAADPTVTDWNTGSIISTAERGKREIRVKDGAGNLVVIYDESEIDGKIAAGRTFKGTVIEAGATKVGSISTSALPAQSTLTAIDLGSYWVYVGAAAHAIGVSDIGGAMSAIDGLILNSGDWLMVANVAAAGQPAVYNYVLIHGDSLGRKQADQLFGHEIWTAGAWEQGSIVRYQETPTSPLQFYKASAGVLQTDPAPGIVLKPLESGSSIQFKMPATVPPIATRIRFSLTKDMGGYPGASILFEHVVTNADNSPAALASNIQGEMAANAGIAAIGTVMVWGPNRDMVMFVATNTTDYYTAAADSGVTFVYTVPREYGGIENELTLPAGTIADGTFFQIIASPSTGGNAVTFDYTVTAGDHPEDVLLQNFIAALNADPVWAALGSFVASANPRSFTFHSIDPQIIATSGGIAVKIISHAPVPANKWVNISPGVDIAKIKGVDVTTVAPKANDVLVYNSATMNWEPKQVGQPMVYFGSDPFDSAHVDAAHLFGMSADTRPDPTIWAPAIGDLYICTTNGVITQLTGTGGTTNPTTRRDSGAVTGGTTATPSAVINHLADIADVDPTSPFDGQSLVYDATANMWKPGSSGAWAVGDIKQSCLTEAQFDAAISAGESGKWVLADGRDVSGTGFAAITGKNKVPNVPINGIIQTYIKVIA